MKTIPRQNILAAVLTVALIGMAGWSFGQLRSGRAAAETAARSLSDCEAIASQIRSLTERPAAAAAAELQVSLLTKGIERAAQSARLSPQSLVRISPQPLRRLADTAYQEKPTQLELRGLSLQQLMAFIHILSTDGSGLRVSALRVAAPRGQEESELWDAQATLTYLVYAPPIKTTNSADLPFP